MNDNKEELWRALFELLEVFREIDDEKFKNNIF